jgi:hypothetical protein
MRTFKTEIDQLLAPARPLVRAVLRNGYDLGLAATADRVQIVNPDFLLNGATVKVLERCFEVLVEVHEAYRAHACAAPFDHDAPLEAIPIPSPAERLRSSQRRLAALAMGVSRADRELSALAHHGLELIVAVREEEVISFGEVDDAVELAAQVRVRSRSGGTTNTAVAAGGFRR